MRKNPTQIYALANIFALLRKMVKSRLDYFKLAWRGLILGLLLPAIVILSLLLGLEIGKRLHGGLHVVFLLSLAFSFIGLLIGSLLVIRLLSKAYG